MTHISSSWTVILKFFLPTVWIVFFGALSLALFFAPIPPLFGLPRPVFRLLIGLFYLSGIIMLYFSVMGLKRVEMDDQFVYVSNYRRHFRYPYHNIEKIEERNFLLFNALRIHFIQKGHFGKHIDCIVNNRRLQQFLESHPAVARLLLKK